MDPARWQGLRKGTRWRRRRGTSRGRGSPQAAQLDGPATGCSSSTRRRQSGLWGPSVSKPRSAQLQAHPNWPGLRVQRTNRKSCRRVTLRSTRRVCSFVLRVPGRSHTCARHPARRSQRPTRWGVWRSLKRPRPTEDPEVRVLVCARFRVGLKHSSRHRVRLVRWFLCSAVW